MRKITLKDGAWFIGVIDGTVKRGRAYTEGFVLSGKEVIGRFNICSKNIKSVEHVK